MRLTSEWTPYYEYAGDDPRETLLDALDRFAEPGFAVDLGCGSGRDTFELLRRGWRVLAIDAEREAIELAHTALDLSRLETQLSRGSRMRPGRTPISSTRALLCRSAGRSTSVPFGSGSWRRCVPALASAGSSLATATSGPQHMLR